MDILRKHGVYIQWECYLAIKILLLFIILWATRVLYLVKYLKQKEKHYYHLYVNSKNKTKEYILKKKKGTINRVTDRKNKIGVISGKRESERVERGVLGLTDTNSYVKQKNKQDEYCITQENIAIIL